MSSNDDVAPPSHELSLPSVPAAAAGTPSGSVDLDRDAVSRRPRASGPLGGAPLAARVMGWEVGCRDTNDFVTKENPTEEDGMHKENTVDSQRQDGVTCLHVAWESERAFFNGTK